ncbi:nucleolin 1-like [Raphanus sativus]|nr:nucleolin 1-like [Raphanus sativus]
MDAYDILRSEREEFESEAAEKAFADRISGKPRALISVAGYNPNLPEDDIKKELIELFSSCGDVTRVNIVPKDPDHNPNLDRHALVILFGDGAEEKALQLNGTDVGGWNALVKVESDEEDEEAARYRSSLINELMNDPKFWYGVSVRGYDTDLPVDEVETSLSLCQQGRHDEIENKVIAFKKQRRSSSIV